MPLPNSRLEQLHAELCSSLTGRQDEQLRTRQTDSAAARKLTQTESEIKDWAGDVSRIEAESADEKSVADLAERARAISQKLCDDSV